MSFNIAMLHVGKITFDLSDFIGKGRYGHVFHGKIKDVLPVAVKRLDRRMVSVDETTLLKAVGHPNVAQCLYLNVKDIEYIFMAMELCACTLAEYVLGPSDPQQLDPFDIMKQLCLGLEHLHNLNIIHGGLSPSNVLLSMPSSSMPPMVKLTDFGLVPTVKQSQLYSPQQEEDEDQELAVALMHSEGWAAPDPQLTFSSDIFITGCLFSFVLVKGFHPFGSDALKRVQRIARKRQMVLTLQQLEHLPNAADVLALIGSMVQHAAAERPSIQQVLENCRFLTIPVALPTVQVQGEPSEKRVKLEAPSDDDDVEIIDAVSDPAQPGPSGTRTAATASTSSARIMDADDKIEALLDLCCKKDLNRDERIRLRELAVDKDVDINCVRGKNGPPLLCLCRFNQSLSLFKCLRSLLQNKAIDVNVQTDKHFTALTLLTRYYQLPNLIDCVQLLLDRNINVHFKTGYEKNALHYLAEYYELDNLIEIARLIVSKMDRFVSAGAAVDMLKKRGFNKESKLLTHYIKKRTSELENAGPV